MCWTDYLAVSVTAVELRVQRVVMPSGVESATLLRGGVVVGPIDRFLAHLRPSVVHRTRCGPMPMICGTISNSWKAESCNGIGWS